MILKDHVTMLHVTAQVENYAAASELELQLTSMVDSLNILIRELLHQVSIY